MVVFVLALIICLVASAVGAFKSAPKVRSKKTSKK